MRRIIDFMLHGRSRIVFFAALGLAMAALVGFCFAAFAEDRTWLTAAEARTWILRDLFLCAAVAPFLLRDMFIESWWPPHNGHQTD